jgi:outer membrane protein assembly factor BamE (lipoprotein component of BamABCDE complex)
MLGLVPGCLISTSSRTEYTGRHVGAETFAQIEPGKTTKDFVLATLGEPSSRATLDDGSELWKWTYRRSRSSRGSVLLLLAANNTAESEGATYVQIRDGVVVRAWQD